MPVLKKAIRNSICFFSLLTVLLCFCLSFSASAASTAEGTISSEAKTYFTGVVQKFKNGTDYVCYKQGDYSFVLVSSEDLNISDSIFSCSSGKMYLYNTRTGSSGYYVPNYSVTDITSFQLTASGSSILYSSLGDYAALIDSKPSKLLSYILYAIIFGIFLLIILKFRRNRRSYISL